MLCKIGRRSVEEALCIVNDDLSVVLLGLTVNEDEVRGVADKLESPYPKIMVLRSMTLEASRLWRIMWMLRWNKAGIQQDGQTRLTGCASV